MNKMNFICTSDKETADKLMSLGYKVIQKNGSIYTFENRMITFSSDIDNRKIVYSNLLTF